MSLITLALLVAPAAIQFEESPSDTFVPSAYVEMTDETTDWEFRLNNTGSTWTSFSSHSGSDYRLFIASGDTVAGKQLGPGDNTLYIREIGGTAPITVHSIEWEILLPALEDGTDQYTGSTGRTWHTMADADIVTLEGEDLARLGYGAQSGDAGFARSKSSPDGTYYMSESGTGTGTLDSPASPSRSGYEINDLDWMDTAPSVDRIVLLPGTYTGASLEWDTSSNVGNSTDGYNELLGTPGTIIEPDGNYAGAIIDGTEYWLIQGLEFDLSYDSGGVTVEKPAIRIDGSVEIQIDSCKLHSGKDAGIVIQPRILSPFVSEEVTISNCEIYNFNYQSSVSPFPWEDRTGILIRPRVDGISILGNHIYQNSGDGIQVTGKEQSELTTAITFASDITIQGNRIHDDRENAIDLKTSSDITIRENLIYGYIEVDSASPASPAIKIHHGADDVEVAFNQIHESRRGIDMSNGDETAWGTSELVDVHYPRNVRVSRNFLEGETDSSGTTRGISAISCDEIWILNNEVRGFDELVYVYYDTIESDQGSGVSDVDPTPRAIANNVLIDQLETTGVSLSVSYYINGTAATWPTTTEPLRPNVFMFDPSQGLMELVAAGITAPAPPVPTQWATSYSYFNTLQSDDEITLPSATLPLVKVDLADWQPLGTNTITDMVAGGSATMDWYDNGHAVSGKNDRRSGVSDPLKFHIGIF